MRKWFAQAVDQAKARKERPVLFYRADREEWRAAWIEDLPGVTPELVDGSVVQWLGEWRR